MFSQHVSHVLQQQSMQFFKASEQIVPHKDDGSESHLSRTTRLFFVKRVVATGTRQGGICVSESSRYQQFLFIVPSARKTVTCQSVEDSLSTLGVDKFIHIIWREWQAVAGHLNFLYDSCTIRRKQSRHIISLLDSCLLLSQSKHLWYSSVSSIRAQTGDLHGQILSFLSGPLMRDLQSVIACCKARRGRQQVAGLRPEATSHYRAFVQCAQANSTMYTVLLLSLTATSETIDTTKVYTV